ncbi:MAG: SpaH/EbpB family LPXTG-anchored major pilin [Eubacteriaceae bacterium]
MKSKLLKKIGGGILSLALMAAVIPGAIAAPIIDTTQTGSITLFKYAMETLPDPGTPGNGTVQTPPAGTTPMPGITFSIERETANNTELDALDPDLVIEWALIATGGKIEVTTDANGRAVFNDLPVGVYTVKELHHPAVKDKVDDFLVSVPITDPTGREDWLYDVYVYPKNTLKTGVDVVKEVWNGTAWVNGTSVNAYDGNRRVDWRLTPTVPVDIATGTKYTLTDTLPGQATYIANTVEILGGTDNWGGNVTAATLNLIETTDYTVAYDDATKTLIIDFTPAGRTKLAVLSNAVDPGAGIAQEAELNVKFTTDIEVVFGDLGNLITNNVELNFTNFLGQEFTPEDDAEVHTGGFSILKVDAALVTDVLQGAEFKIYPTEADAKAETNQIGTTLTTDANGVAAFEGLKYGDYWLVETKAPVDATGKAYNLLKEPLRFTVSATSHEAGNHILVENSKGFTLPITGGSGTMLFSVVGLLLIGGAILMIVGSQKKKMQ